MESESSCPCSVNQELFGKRGDIFDTEIAPLWRDVYDSLIARAKIRKGSTVLDVGTGSGEVALRLSRVVGRAGEVVAIDEQVNMLDIAKRKARDRALRVKFKRLPMEKMAGLPTGRFDSVLANYSLCCCVDYKAALAECLRVLKAGGRLTYNHGGPIDPLENQLLFSIFEKYKTPTPSRELREFRRSKDTQVESFKKYRDPFTALELLRSIGFKDSEATVTRHSLVYKDARHFIDEWLSFDWSAEAEEIPPERLSSFKDEAIDAVGLASNAGPRFIVERDVVYFTAVKLS